MFNVVVVAASVEVASTSTASDSTSTSVTQLYPIVSEHSFIEPQLPAPNVEETVLAMDVITDVIDEGVVADSLASEEVVSTVSTTNNTSEEAAATALPANSSEEMDTSVNIKPALEGSTRLGSPIPEKKKLKTGISNSDNIEGAVDEEKSVNIDNPIGFGREGCATEDVSRPLTVTAKGLTASVTTEVASRDSSALEIKPAVEVFLEGKQVSTFQEGGGSQVIVANSKSSTASTSIISKDALLQRTTAEGPFELASSGTDREAAPAGSENVGKPSVLPGMMLE